MHNRLKILVFVLNKKNNRINNLKINFLILYQVCLSKFYDNKTILFISIIERVSRT